MKRKKTTSPQTLKELIKKPQMWIGILTFIVFAALAMRTASFQTEAKNTMCKNIAHVSATNTVSLSETSITPFPREKTYVIQQNDNFWKISEKTCGTGKYYLAIQQRNGYDNDWKALHAGETISILCEE